MQLFCLHNVFHLPPRTRSLVAFSTTPLQLLMYRSCILYIYCLYKSLFSHGGMRLESIFQASGGGGGGGRSPWARVVTSPISWNFHSLVSLHISSFYIDSFLAILPRVHYSMMIKISGRSLCLFNDNCKQPSVADEIVSTIRVTIHHVLICYIWPNVHSVVSTSAILFTSNRWDRFAATRLPCGNTRLNLFRI